MTDRGKTVVGRFVWIGWAIVLSVSVVVLGSLAADQREETAEVLRQSNADRRQAEVSLKRAEESLRRADTLIGMLPAAIVICDEAGIIKLISEDADEILGWSAEELVGHSITRVMDEATAAKHSAAFVAAVEKIKSLGPAYIYHGNYYVEGYAKDGRKRPLRIHMNARLMESGVVEFYSLIVSSRPQATIKPLDKPPEQEPLIEAPEVKT